MTVNATQAARHQPERPRQHDAADLVGDRRVAYDAGQRSPAGRVGVWIVDRCWSRQGVELTPAPSFDDRR